MDDSTCATRYDTQLRTWLPAAPAGRRRRRAGRPADAAARARPARLRHLRHARRALTATRSRRAHRAASVDHFAARGEGVEWKLHGHDAPADLARPAASGRVRAGGAGDRRHRPGRPAGRPVAGDAGRPAAARGDGARRSRPHRRDGGDGLERGPDTHRGGAGGRARGRSGRHHRDRGRETDDPVVCAGWVRYVGGTEFATLWGGSTLPQWRGAGDLQGPRALPGRSRGDPRALAAAGRRVRRQPADSAATGLRGRHDHDAVRPRPDPSASLPDPSAAHQCDRHPQQGIRADEQAAHGRLAESRRAAARRPAPGAASAGSGGPRRRARASQPHERPPPPAGSARRRSARTGSGSPRPGSGADGGRQRGPAPGQPGALDRATAALGRVAHPRTRRHGEEDQPARPRRPPMTRASIAGNRDGGSGWPRRMARSQRAQWSTARTAITAPEHQQRDRDGLADVWPAQRRDERGHREPAADQRQRRCGSRPGRCARWPARTGSRAWSPTSGSRAWRPGRTMPQHAPHAS